MRKFKSGDKVVCIGTSSRPYRDNNMYWGGCGWKKGMIFIIKKVDYSYANERYVCWPCDELSGVYSTHLELYKKEIKIFGIVNFINSITKKEE